MTDRASTRGRAERTATSAFGVGRREGHDASGFYGRFEAPEITTDTDVTPLPDLGQGEAACITADSTAMVLPDGGRLPDDSVALVVTSPPYFVGKEYEEALGEGHVPTTYLEYLDLLTEVFTECKRVLEPGGRIAVNVANLGRKPYRSLSADVIGILQDRLHLLLRGEVIWRKAEGASGSCAWGSYRSAANPVLRDVTERVVVASKGRFDRARSRAERRRLGLPHQDDLTADEFLAATLDVWNIPPESARRVEHPAPFPVELPQRLIGLYTYEGDLVVDPFMGSGSTLLAAIRTDRRYLGYDLDPGYTSTARARVGEELRRRSGVQVRMQPPPTGDEEANDLAPRDGRGATATAEGLLEAAGFRVDRRNARQRGLGLSVSFEVLDAADRRWYVEVAGAFTTTGGGLLRTEAVWRTLGRASVLAARHRTPLLVLTSHLPRAGSEGDQALRAGGPGLVFDVMDLLAAGDRRRLEHYARGEADVRPLPGWWTAADLGDR
jgi:DNA modification methylase